MPVGLHTEAIYDLNKRNPLGILAYFSKLLPLAKIVFHIHLSMVHILVATSFTQGISFWLPCYGTLQLHAMFNLMFRLLEDIRWL